MSGPLFSTCVILCTLGMNPITEVACFLLSLLFSPARIAWVYNTGDQNLPKAFGSRRKGDFFPTKITQHGTLISQVTVVIKSCLAPMRTTCVCVCMMWLCHDTSIYLHLFAFLKSDRKSCVVFIANCVVTPLGNSPVTQSSFPSFQWGKDDGLFMTHFSGSPGLDLSPLPFSLSAYMWSTLDTGTDISIQGWETVPGHLQDLTSRHETEGSSSHWL